MSQQHTRSARLAVHSLEARAVPAVVTTVETFRPLGFTLQGSLAIDTVTGTGEFKTTENYTATLTAKGTVEYSSATAGLSGTVSVDGSGRGVSPAGGYTDTFEGSYSFADENGGWTVVTDYTGTQTKVETGTSTTAPGGVVVSNGTFDPSNYAFRSTWTSTAADKSVTGLLTGTVYQSGTAATDLTISQLTADTTVDGTLTVNATVSVTGQLMKAASHGAGATYLTAAWESEDDSEDVGVDIPISWNAGKATIEINGLIVPEWATRIAFKVDGENAVAESREGNNVRSLNVAGVHDDDDDGGVDSPTTPRVPFNFQLATDGSNHVLWLDQLGATIFRVPTFETSYQGPITLAAGDINDDGVLDLVAAVGAGGGPRVKYFDGKTGAMMGNFLAYEEEFRGGVNVAVGDVTGDGKADIVTGTGEGGAPRVRVYNHYAFGGFVLDFYAYEESFRGGVTVVATDLNGDKVAEVVTGAGAGGAPLIHVYDGNTGQKKWSLFAAPEELRGGATIGLRDAGQNDLRLVVDTHSDRGVYQYRAGDPKKGESFLVLLPGPDQANGFTI